MAAPEGNQFWKMRASHGPPRLYDNADALWADCEEYFLQRIQLEWNKQPLPFTQASLCLFLGIPQTTWIDWRRNREDLSHVITRVDDIIRDHKMTGAIVGAYNHHIIARDLGLADRQELTGKDGAALKVEHEIKASDRLKSMVNQIAERSGEAGKPPES